MLLHFCCTFVALFPDCCTFVALFNIWNIWDQLMMIGSRYCTIHPRCCTFCDPFCSFWDDFTRLEAMLHFCCTLLHFFQDFQNFRWWKITNLQNMDAPKLFLEHHGGPKIMLHFFLEVVHAFIFWYDIFSIFEISLLGKLAFGPEKMLHFCCTTCTNGENDLTRSFEPVQNTIFELTCPAS